MIVCLCHGITEKDLEDSVSPTEPVLEKIQACTGAGTDCGACLGKIQAWVERQKGLGITKSVEPGSSQPQSSE